MSRQLATLSGIVFALSCAWTTVCAQDPAPGAGGAITTTDEERCVLELVREPTTVAQVAARLDLLDLSNRSVFVQVLAFSRLIDVNDAKKLFDEQSEYWKSWVESHATARLGPILPEHYGVFASASEDHFWSTASRWQSACSVDFIRFGQPTVAELYHLLNSPNDFTRLDGLYVMARTHPDEFQSRADEMGGRGDALFRAACKVLRSALGHENKDDPLPFTLAEGASIVAATGPAPGERGVSPGLWYNLYRRLIERLLIMQTRALSNVSQSEREELSKRKRRE